MKTHPLWSTLLPLFLSIFCFKSWSQVIPKMVIKDAIHIGTFYSIERMVKQAQTNKNPAVLIELDTPGGFLEATRDIVQLFLNTNDVKIIVWVSPQGARAASAGSMITMAAHFATMAPSTSIGAATPVSGGGEDVGKDMKAKIENDTISWVRGIAEKRGRNAKWAEESVSKAASVEAKVALEQNIIDGVFASEAEVLQAAAKKFSWTSPVTTEPFELQMKEKFLSFISNPNIAMGLMALGALGIYIEMSNPGLVIPGTIGALSLALGAMTMKIVPIRPGAFILLFLGLILLAIEILTPLPTWGVAGAAGLLSLLLSGMFLLDPAQTNLRLDGGLWLPMFFVMSGFMIWLGWETVRSFRMTYRQGYGATIGEIAVVKKVSPDGQLKVKIHGETWNAKGDGTFTIGEKVKISNQDDLLLTVTKV